jgi:hypothetical protein
MSVARARRMTGAPVCRRSDMSDGLRWPSFDRRRETCFMFATPALRHRVWKSKYHMRTRPASNDVRFMRHPFPGVTDQSEARLRLPQVAVSVMANWTRTMHPPECIHIYYSLQIAAR